MTLLTALRHGATRERLEKLRTAVGVSRRTLERWRRWWLEEFPRSAFWKWARARLRAVEEGALPLSLLECFVDTTPEGRIIDLLRFILPLSTAAVIPESCGLGILPQKMPRDLVAERR